MPVSLKRKRLPPRKLVRLALRTTMPVVAVSVSTANDVELRARRPVDDDACRVAPKTPIPPLVLTLSC
jgi:hypothetical protein